jgi:DNA-binding transcriptional regulator GbsR (MarR family)
MEFWGFSRHMGRFWTLLYLSPDPLCAAEIQEALSISAGTASSIARQLQHWGVVHEVRKPGDRKLYYRAETDLWKMGTRVLAERERNRIREAQRTFEDSVETLRSEEKALGKEEKKISRFRRERIERLSELCQMADGLIEMIMAQRKVDLGELPEDLTE